jgi:hypothetical protein
MNVKAALAPHTGGAVQIGALVHTRRNEQATV